jgi:hypothetical protein
MDVSNHPDNPRLAFWRQHRRRRLLFMLGRYAIVIAIVLLVGWATGGFWLRGLAIIASVLLVIRLAFFFYNGRHIEERLAKRTQPRRRFRA